MQKVTFTNSRGESIVFDASGSFILSHIDGLGGPPADIKSTKSPYQDGSSFVDIQLAERALYITGAIMGFTRADMYEKRRLLSRVLNPKLGQGRLIYTNDYRSYAINAISDESPVIDDRIANNQKFTISFICNDPYFQDAEMATKALRSEVGGMKFPLKLPTRFALASYRGVFVNTGDVETPVEIRYKGPATNPIVENETTGEYIKVNCVLSATATLIISTEFGSKRVEILNADGTRTNVFHWIDLGSTFFQLQTGDNMLRYGSSQDSGQLPATVTVSWNNRFVGG